MTKSKQIQLDELKDKIISDKVCSELSEQATQLVFGEGNPDAEILFIGEAPGKKEDSQGLPFIGAAGKFLNELLGMINLKRDLVYITNIVKYRPPNNRDPLPEEKAAFMPYLDEQINIIRPKLIVTLGRHSMNCFMPDLKISEVHGKTKRLLGRVYLPLFHPAAALYNGGLRQTLIDDFANIPIILNSIQKIS
jgi:uracil-DNA glycosylase family 4